MSAIISLPPGAALTATQAALNGPAGVDGAGGLSGDAGGTGSFAALFQQLAGKQLSAELLGQIDVSADAADAAAAAGDAEAIAGEDLAALMPFLEAMGIVPVAPVPTEAGEISGVPVDADPTEALPLAGIAPVLPAQTGSAAAISAVEAGDHAVSPAPLNAQFSSQSGNRQNDPGMQAFMTQVTAQAQGTTSAAQTPAEEAASQFSTALQSAGERQAAFASTTQAANTPAPQPASAAPPTLHVEQPVGNAAWGQEVGNRIVWMANRMESKAELVLTPPQMGRVEVSLTVSGDNASASFVSSNPAVREALEAALPRLREVLADAGIQLGQAQVGAEHANQSAQHGKNGDNFAPDRDAGNGTLVRHADDAQNVAPGLKTGRGLVDVFA
ncbi:MAG: flagellar hook-length control protein FliK [Pseudomonadota bacterium]